MINSQLLTFILPLAVKEVSDQSLLPHKPDSGSASLIKRRYNENIRTANDASRKHIDLKENQKSAKQLPYSTFLAPCALNFFRVAANFLSNFFLSAHFNRLLYIEGNEFKD